MARAGRGLEKLIERIERVINPRDIEIKSPDFFKDLQTGELREVDVSLKFKNLPHPFTSIIESRDRIAIQDVIWLEQLIEKRRSIGVDQVIAVSSSGFTAPAVQKAKALNITLLTLEEVAGEKGGIVLAKKIRLRKDHSELLEANIDVDTTIKNLTPYDELPSKSDELVKAKIFYKNNHELWGSVADVFLSKAPKDVWDNIPPDKKKKDVRLELNFVNQNDRLNLRFKEGYVPVKRITILATVSYSEEDVPLADYTLVDIISGRTLAIHSEAVLEHSGSSVRLSLTKENDGVIKFNISKLIKKEVKNTD